MHARRIARLANAFSKKMENQARAMGLHFVSRNFVRIDKTIKTGPTMVAGICDRPWQVSDRVAVAQAREAGRREARKQFAIFV
jgi:hypothetical protein